MTRRTTILAGMFLALLALFGAATTYSAPFVLLFGWAGFLWRILPKVSVDGPSVVVGCAALVLFAGGVHWAGRSWLRAVPAATGTTGRPWKVRWSLAVVAAVCLLFAAGVSLVGATHQFVWLLASERPLVIEAQVVRIGGADSRNNLKGIGMGADTYASDTTGAFPPGGTFAPDGTMLHSWETHILPYLGYVNRDIDLARAWNGSRNQKYFKCVLPDFVNPAIQTSNLFDAEGYGLSHYAANSYVMNGNKPIRPDTISDGLSNTFLVGEVNAQFKPWGHPVNWRDPTRGINRSPYGFGGAAGAGGANFVMADGSVRFVSERVSPAVLRALSTPRGGEGIGADALDP